MLRQFRVAVGLTQEELAAAAGLGVRTVRDLELGVSGWPQRRTVERLASALRLDPTDRGALLEQARTARIVGSAVARVGRGTGAAPVHSLPRDVPDLVGRDDVVRSLLDADPGGGITVVNGHPGIGKTSLVVHVAHRLAAAYPTVVYAELGERAVPETLGDLLVGLGVEPDRIPVTVAGRQAAYRRLTSGQRGVVVLNDPLSQAQAQVLLPAGAGWRVLIASRGRLTGLPVGRRITIDVLDEHVALRLLAGVIGAERVTREPAAAAELVELCGRLPIALRAAANWLNIRPLWTIEALVKRLRDEPRRLSRLSAGDLAVRALLAESFHRLPLPEQRVLRRLGLLPWPVHDDATLLALADPADGAALETLHDSGLLVPAGPTGWIRLHPLTALYCAEQSAQDEPGVRTAAIDRACAAIVETAQAHAAALFDDGSIGADGTADVSSVDRRAREAGAWLVQSRDRWWWAVLRLDRPARWRDLLSIAESLSLVARRYPDLVPWSELFTRSHAAAGVLGDRTEQARQGEHLRAASSRAQAGPSATR